MNRLLAIWREEDGVLSFEWTLLLTLLTLGIVAGLAGARDAIIDELGDVAEAAQVAFHADWPVVVGRADEGAVPVQILVRDDVERKAAVGLEDQSDLIVICQRRSEAGPRHRW